MSLLLLLFFLFLLHILSNIIYLFRFLDFCAAIIQRWWRLLRAYQGDDFLTAPPPTTVGDSKLPTPSLAKDSVGSDLATSEITDVADILESRDDSGIISDRRNAAKVIQKSWRRHIVSLHLDCRISVVFNVFQDFRSQLKCIRTFGIFIICEIRLLRVMRSLFLSVCIKANFDLRFTQTSSDCSR